MSQTGGKKRCVKSVVDSRSLIRVAFDKKGLPKLEDGQQRPTHPACTTNLKKLRVLLKPMVTRQNTDWLGFLDGMSDRKTCPRCLKSKENLCLPLSQ